MTDLLELFRSHLSEHYDIERELGGGGMSRVFVARDTALDRKVVIKVLPPDLAAGVNTDRFQREIQLAAQLQHPHIVPVLSAGVVEGVPYYTMPFIEGESLGDRLARAGELPVHEALRILREVADALAYAHARGIVHRDIKPANILLSNGHALVADFGVAKALNASTQRHEGAGLTGFGMSIGTPRYMAPEQAAADPSTDHRADIYAFGVMAYELLAGDVPFAGRTSHELLVAHLTELPVPLSQRRPSLPPALSAVIMACLEKRPSDRPQTAAEVRDALEAIDVSTSSTHASTSAWARAAAPAHSPVRAVAMYVGVALAVALVAKAAEIAIALPDWAFKGVIALLLLALPFVAMRPWMKGKHFTWRRALVGGGAVLTAFVVIVGGYMGLRAAGIGPAGSLLAAGKIKQKQQVLLADFRALGADSVLGGVVTEAFRTDLGQSPVVTIVPASAIRQALVRMQRPADTKLDTTLAREVANREGIKAIVDGTVTRLGTSFVLTARLLAAETGDEIASFRETAKSQDDLIAAIDRLTKAMRARIGESLRDIRANPKLEEVTTPSLAALQKYAQAVQAADGQSDYRRAATLLEEALKLDTTFAMAWRKLSVVLDNEGIQRVRAREAMDKAFHYRDRLTESERLLTVGSYYMTAAGSDPDKAIEAYKSLLAIDSTNRAALNNLGLMYSRRFDNVRALEIYKRTLALDSSSGNAWFAVAGAQWALGHVDSARQTFLYAKRRFPSYPAAPLIEPTMLTASLQFDSASKSLAAMKDSAGKDPRLRVGIASIQASLALAHGRVNDAARLVREAMGANVARGGEASQLGFELGHAFTEVWFYEQRDKAIKRVDSALTASPLQAMPVEMRPYGTAAEVYAMAGRPDKGRALLAQMIAANSDSLHMRMIQIERHMVQAEIALAEHRPQDAIIEFTIAAPERSPISTMADLGRAYDIADNADSTIALYERYVSTPDLGRLNTDATILAGIYKRLGELYDKRNDRPRAVANYRKFVDLWANADPELQPKVAAVKQRLATLGDLEKK